MSDKKNEDYVVRMPEGSGIDEKDTFMRSNSHSHRSRQEGGLSSTYAKVYNSPGASILAYCSSSISMTVVNKYVVSGSSWNLNFFYLAVQSIICVAAIIACKQTGIIPNIAPFEQNKAKKWFPITLFFVGMIYTSIKSLQFLSVPVYTIFKNLTIIVIAYGEVLWFGGSVSPMALLSFGLMVLSSVIAAWADIQAAINGAGHSAEASDALSTLNAGYAWMGMNVVCTASYVLGTRKVIKKLNFKDWDTMFYNNLLTIPVLLVCSLVAEDWSGPNLAKNFPVETRNTLFLGMIYSGLGAIFISYCSAWCIRATSSTTYSMVGALNKLPLAVSGLIFFDAPITFGSVSAIFVGFVSGIVYAWAKIQGSGSKKSVLPISKPVVSASSQSDRDANS